MASKGEAVVEVKKVSGTSLSTVPPQHTQYHVGSRMEQRRIDVVHLNSLCLSAGAVARSLPPHNATSGDSKPTVAEQ
jgi:hypothetical protein